MHTQAEPAPTEPACEGRGSRLAEPPGNIDQDPNVLQPEHSSSLERLALPSAERRVENNLTPELAEVTRPTVPGVAHSRNSMVAVWKYVIHILVVSLVLAVLPCTSESFPGVSCKLPGLPRHFSRCVHGPDLVGNPIVIPDFITLARLQSRLEYVMEDAAHNSLVAANIKCSEMVLRDLTALVKLSSLSRKSALERDLNLFVKDAKVASRNLQEFGSRVWAAADQIVALNEHTLIIHENGKYLETPRGYFRSIANFLTCNEREVTVARQAMRDTWLQEIELLAKILARLIDQAQHNVDSLELLKQRLDNIQDRVAGEKREIHGEKQVLKRQWFQEFKETILGINQEKRQSHSDSLELLRMVHEERQRALDYAIRVLFKLQQMFGDLDNLRDEVATPLIGACSSNIPIKAHMGSIREATERLVCGQARMKKIEDIDRRKKFCSR